MSHRSTPEKELEVKLELYLGFGTFGKVGFWWSWWILFAFKSLKMVRNGTKNVQKMFFVIFGVFEFFVNFRFFSKNDVFRFFAHDYSFLIEKSFKSPRNTAYFVPNFLTEFFGTQISRDWDRNRKSPSLKIFALFHRLAVFKPLFGSISSLWGFSNSVSFETQYFDLWHQINAWAHKKLLIDFNFIDAVLT